ncbi:MAG: hypothetical protein RSE07_02025, partial [Oscillospiraceae bacterium]
MIKEKRVLPYLAVPIVVSTFMCSIIDYYTSKYNYANYKYIIYSMLVFVFLYLIVPFLKKENMKKIVAEVKKIRNKPEELEDYLEELKQRESMVVVFLDKHGREIGT